MIIKKIQKKLKKLMTLLRVFNAWTFLFFVILLYIILLIINRQYFIESLKFFLTIIIRILPIFILILLLLVIVDLFVKPQSISKHLGKESGIKGWIYAIVAGIISTGPIYMWYPLLSDLKKRGAREAYIVTFLYNRAIKPALLPLFIFYFGLKYVIILTVVMIVASVFQGIMVETLLNVNKSNKSK